MRWIITSAWPYAHGTPHLGNIVSSLLSADIFTRFLRIQGHEVIYVTGSDEHGTPIEVKAIQLGVKPKDLTDKVHNEILKILKGFKIEPDNYTRTHNEVHIQFVREVFDKIYKNGYIFTKKDKLLYCPRDKIYLPDRFVIGKCPYCGYESARGDQCENCGRLLTP
ncbi:methionine--tRNA ligase, partial [Candidatus Geothermarchaeota archaeon]